MNFFVVSVVLQLFCSYYCKSTLNQTNCKLQTAIAIEFVLIVVITFWFLIEFSADV